MSHIIHKTNHLPLSSCAQLDNAFVTLNEGNEERNTGPADIIVAEGLWAPADFQLPVCLTPIPSAEQQAMASGRNEKDWYHTIYGVGYQQAIQWNTGVGEWKNTKRKMIFVYLLLLL